MGFYYGILCAIGWVACMLAFALLERDFVRGRVNDQMP